MLDGVRILSQRTRTDIASIAIELGKIEGKSEALLGRQAPKTDLIDAFKQIFDMLSDLQKSVDDIDCSGDGQGGSLPEMGPMTIISVPPYPGDQAKYENGYYEIIVDKAPAEVFMKEAFLAIAQLMSVQKSWRNFVIPKPKVGVPYTITWEEVE